MVSLRQHFLQNVLDARDLHSHVIHRQSRDLRNLLVTEPFKQQRDYYAVLVRECANCSSRSRPRDKRGRRISPRPTSFSRRSLPSAPCARQESTETKWNGLWRF